MSWSDCFLNIFNITLAVCREWTEEGQELRVSHLYSIIAHWMWFLILFRTGWPSKREFWSCLQCYHTARRISWFWHPECEVNFIYFPSVWFSWYFVVFTFIFHEHKWNLVNNWNPHAVDKDLNSVWNFEIQCQKCIIIFAECSLQYWQYVHPFIQWIFVGCFPYARQCSKH